MQPVTKLFKRSSTPLMAKVIYQPVLLQDVPNADHEAETRHTFVRVFYESFSVKFYSDIQYVRLDFVV